MRADSLIGAQLASYRIEQLIGEGGMSQIYLAEHVVLQKKVALKLLGRELADDENFRERFLRESRLAAALDHPNIVDIYDAGEADGRLFIAMRYIAGSDLRTQIKEQGALPPERALSILSQAAVALDAAHERGLVHRDVKPGNILLGAGDHVYLTDFGVAKQNADRRGLTRTGFFVGTLDYAAPEQIRGEQLDGRADVYAFGCLLYQCLSGKLPYERDSDVQVMFAHLEEPPPRLSDDFPPALDAVVGKAMAKRREDRYPSCAQLVAAARNALTSPAQAPEQPVPSQGVAPSPDTTIDRLPDFVPEPTPAPPKRRRPSRNWLLAAAGAGAFLIALASLGLAVLREPPVLPKVTGIALDARTGKPVKGVTVSADGKEKVTNAAGRFVLSDVTEGKAISLDSCAYQPREVGASERLRVALDPAPVTGTLTSDLTTRPVRAKVTGRQTARAGRDGRFTLYGACPGDVVRASAPNHRTARAKIGMNRQLDVALSALSVSDGFASGAGLFGESRGASSEKFRSAGKFHIVVRRRNWQALQVTSTDVDLADTRIDVQASKIRGSTDSSFGVVCRWGGGDRYYVLEISPEGLYRIQRKQSGRFRTLRDWSPSSAIRPGKAANRIVATCRGRKAVTLELAVNGRLLARVRDARGLAAGRVGLVASSYRRPGTHVVFDNFELKRL